jgi:cob(I)alamin adenosyltransferase
MAPSAIDITKGLTKTTLSSGLQVEKDSPRVEVIGALEELSGWLAVLAQQESLEVTRRPLETSRSDLALMCAQLNSPPAPLLSEIHLRRLYQELAKFRALDSADGAPSGDAAAFVTLTWAVCRRAERRLVTLFDLDPPGNALGVEYLNTLSKYIGIINTQLVT